MAVADRGQLARQADADDPRHRLVERLAQQDGLGLDAADAVAQDAEPVDHRRVGVRPDDRVRERDAAALVRAIRDDGGQVLQVDLVDDAGARRDHAQVPEGRLRPAQELVALAVALVLALHVEREGAGPAPGVDLHGVVDDQVRGHEGVDARGIAAERRHRVAHRRQVHDRRHAGEVLEDDAAGHERDLGLAAGARAPGGQAATSSSRTMPPPAWRSAFSSRILRVTGALPRSRPSARPEVARESRRYRSGRPGPSDARAPNALGVVMRLISAVGIGR